MLTVVSERLQEKILQAISNNEESAVFIPEVILHNPETEFKLVARYLKQLNIAQDFRAEYTDRITAIIEIKQDEQRSIMQNTLGLECTITLTPIDANTLQILYDQDQIILETKVMLDDNIDLDKVAHPSAFGTQNLDETEPNTIHTSSQEEFLLEFPLNLIEPKIYDLRHVRLNTMFNNTSMIDMLHWSCQQFGAEEVKIIPPNNQQVYSNAMIPPMKDIATLFPYFQSEYGIYSKGLGYYVVDDVFYVYPIYDTAVETSPVEGVIHIINAPTYSYMGLPIYHKTEELDTYICSNQPVRMEPLNAKGSENIGNVQISVNADGMRDKYVSINDDGTVTRNTNDITIVSLQNTAPNVKQDMQNIMYTGETTNIYKNTSLLAEMDGTMFQTIWQRAIPRLIKPGHNIIFHYDAAHREYKTQNGRVLQILFTSELHTSNTNVPWISFTASVAAKLDAEVNSDAEVQYAN